MKYVILFLCLSLSSADVLAQEDSTRVTVPGRVFLNDSAAVAALRFAISNPLMIGRLMPQQFSTIVAGYRLQKGKLTAAQGATSVSTAFLSSEGSTVLGGVKLYGAFSYHKVFEDSTRFAHQTRNNPTTPYYFGSPANNHYERSVYHFRALGARSFFAGRLNTGIGFDYHIADHFSNNDPRGSIKEYQLDVKPALAYRFGQKLVAGAGMTMGYGQEKVSIGYKNRRYYESTAFPRYVNYLLNGYGEPTPQTNERNYNDFMNRLGFEAQFSLSETPAGTFFLNVSTLKERQEYDRRSSIGIIPLASYTLFTDRLTLGWNRLTGRGRLFGQAAYTRLTGSDYNLTYLANNYLYNASGLAVKLNYSYTNEKVLFNYLFGVEQQSEERIDGINGNTVYVNHILTRGGYGFSRQLHEQRSWGLALEGAYRLALNNELKVNQLNESFFTREVILHNYLYDTSSILSARLGADYSFPFYRNMQAAVKLDMGYAIRTGLASPARPMASMPGKDRFEGSLSINIYF